MGAPEPDKLGDALMLLLEGVYASGQLFGVNGPRASLSETANTVIDGHLAKR